MTRFDVARTQQPKSTAAYGSLRFGPLRYQLKRTIGMLPTPDNSECSRQPCCALFLPMPVRSWERPLIYVHLARLARQPQGPISCRFGCFAFNAMASWTMRCPLCARMAG
ncbi:hypothetical protein [Tateyamaria sp.]|uniref:hypothetical protein n=1 Tax=Tateyamaria sp. TaxID=1929288 RepID=UPI003B225E93